MTGTGRFERRLHVGLDELAEPRFPDYFDEVLAVTSRRRQRPAWTFPGRWIPMVDIARRPAFAPSLPWRAIVLVLALLLAAGLGLFVVGSANRAAPPFGAARNGLIVYSSNGDIYAGDPNGGSKLILGGPAEDVEPNYSRTGTRLFFIRSQTDTMNTFWTMNADGSHIKQVTPDPIATLTMYDWGPTDDAIYYVAGELGTLRLHSVAADGSAQPRIIAPDLAISAFWFRPPDGREMVVRTQDSSGVALWVMNVDGTNRRMLVAPNGSDPEEHDMAEPRYSPDGTKIAYQRWNWNGTDYQNMQMHVINADGTGDHVIPDPGATFDGWPVWTVDSKQLVIQRAFPNGSTYLDFGYPYAIFNADGTGSARPIGPPVAGQHAEISPDGTKLITFWGDDPSKTQTIIDLADGTFKSVPWSTGSYPSWQRLAP